MPALNQNHIDYIIQDLQYRGIVLDGFRDEVIDHVCSAVEAKISDGARFIDAYHDVLRTFGHTGGLRQTQKEIITTENQNTRLMLRNYFRIAFRNLSKHRFYTLINVAGLALGLSACILILLYVQHETSYDKHHENAHRILRINGEIKFAGNHWQLATAPAPLAQVLVQEYPEVEHAVRFRARGSYLVKAEKAIESFREFNVIWSDSTFFTIFSVPVLQGDANTALREPESIAISQAMAEKYFPDEVALGQTLILDNRWPFKVTAVFDNMPVTGHFRFDLIMSMAGLEEAQSTNFLSNNFNTYVLLKEEADPEVLEKKLPGIVVKYIGPQAAEAFGGDFNMNSFLAAGNKLEYTLMPLPDIHLHSDLTSELSANSDITYIYLFSAVAVFILFIACINFMNLSTARSANRAKEVGIRKVMGSLRSHLVRQFLMESTLLSIFSFALSIGIAHLTLPLFNELSGLALSLPFHQFGFYVTLFLCSLLVGFAAGIYPSLFLSGFQPAKVLKGQLSLGARSRFIRGGLVVFQFSISIFLIIGTFAVNSQLDFIQNKKVGFNKDQVIMISDAYLLGDQAEAFKNEVLNNSFITDGTLSGYVPVNIGWRNDNSFWPEGSQPTSENMVGMQNWLVDWDYLATMKMNIIKGRGFARDFPSDSSAVVLNETAVKHFNLGDDPIGKKIATFGENHPDGTLNPDHTKYFTVIGVVEDFNFESLTHNIDPLGLMLGKSSGYASFRFEASDTKDVIKAIEKTWNDFAKGQPFQYTFLDESFAQMYASEERLGKIFAVFAALAIIIACLGVFALTAFTAEQRTREIGIRKILGASVSGIVVLLSREFGKLILISFLLSTPLAWYAVNWWLEDYQYKVEVGIPVYVLAGIFAFIIAWLTMGFQAIKAAIANPVDSLRSE